MTINILISFYFPAYRMRLVSTRIYFKKRLIGLGWSYLFILQFDLDPVTLLFSHALLSSLEWVLMESLPRPRSKLKKMLPWLPGPHWSNVSIPFSLLSSSILGSSIRWLCSRFTKNFADNSGVEWFYCY